MRANKFLIMLLLAMQLAACSSKGLKLLDEPEMSPVGSGLTTSSTSSAGLKSFSSEEAGKGDWIGGPADYFRDHRAAHRGDLITVKINLNDKATFNNSSSRSKKAQANANADFDLNFLALVGQGEADAATASNSAASGQGVISRSEKLSLSVTAVVREVFENGTMLIEGSQETMVNFERRDIKISGIVDPRDIGPDKSIDFSKIAEARVRYGGSGKVSDVQKPGWGLQLWDKLNPF